MNNGVLGATAACGRDPDVSAHVSALAPSVTGVDACSRSWKVEPEGGGRLFVETCPFRIIFVSFLREIMFPHVRPIRCDQKTHRSVYFTAGQEKNIFLPQGVSDFWWSREYSQSYLKRMSQNIWEMVRFGWVLKWKWWVSGGKKDLGNFHIVQPIRCDPANASFRVLYCGKKISFYHLGCQTLVVARVS